MTQSEAEAISTLMDEVERLQTKVAEQSAEIANFTRIIQEFRIFSLSVVSQPTKLPPTGLMEESFQVVNRQEQVA